MAVSTGSQLSTADTLTLGGYVTQKTTVLQQLRQTLDGLRQTLEAVEAHPDKARPARPGAGSRHGLRGWHRKS